MHIRHGRELNLAELAGMIAGVDLILAEGFKSQPGPKIEVVRRGFSEGRLSLGSGLEAVVSDMPVSEVSAVPVFRPDEIEPLSVFIESRWLAKT